MREKIIDPKDCKSFLPCPCGECRLCARCEGTRGEHNEEALRAYVDGLAQEEAKREAKEEAQVIEAIKPGTFEWEEGFEAFTAPVTKFLYMNDDDSATGHRGLILRVEGSTARLLGLTGEFRHKVILVEEDDPDQWPKFKEFVD